MHCIGLLRCQCRCIRNGKRIGFKANRSENRASPMEVGCPNSHTLYGHLFIFISISHPSNQFHTVLTIKHTKGVLPHQINIAIYCVWFVAITKFQLKIDQLFSSSIFCPSIVYIFMRCSFVRLFFPVNVQLFNERQLWLVEVWTFLWVSCQFCSGEKFK